MQKIDWLRDMEEAQAYPEAKVVLREWTDSYSSTIVKVMETFTDRRDVGWMPVDVDHYNKWVIKRKNNKKLDDYYFPELADQTCETCAHNATTTDGITHCKFPECAHGNISRWKAKQEACSECKGLGRIYDMGDDDGTLNYTSETCPACNGSCKEIAKDNRKYPLLPDDIKIVWYDSPEAIEEAYWKKPLEAEGLTLVDLKDGEQFGYDEHGNKVPFSQEAFYDGCRHQKVWGFVDDENTIHAWKSADAPVETVIWFFAHELGHLAQPEDKDELQEEFRAEQIASVAVKAFQLAVVDVNEQTMTDYERGWYHSYKLFLSMLTRGKND